MNILDAFDDPALFGAMLRKPASWRAWRAFLAGLFGLPMTRMRQPCFANAREGRSDR